MRIGLRVVSVISFYLGATLLVFSLNWSISSEASECRTLFPVSYEKAEGRYLWGLIDCHGNLIANPEFELAFESQGEIGVLIASDDTLLVNSTGVFKRLSGIRALTGVSEGVFFAKQEDSLVLIDKEGRISGQITNSQITDSGDFFVMPFNEGLAPVSGKEGIGYIDRTGKFVIPPSFDYANRFNEGIATVLTKDGWGVIDRKGKFVIPPAPKQSFGEFSEGKIRVYKEDKGWFYFDSSGNQILQVDCDYSGDYSDGLVKCLERKSGLWGFLDSAGKTVIKPRFEDAFDFSDGLAAVLIGGKWGFIDRSGKIVVDPEFEAILTPFRSGRAYVRNEVSEGYIDQDGDWTWKRLVRESTEGPT